VMLSCMDYRLMRGVSALMEQLGHEDAYDHLVLAGASLGALQTAHTEWGATFWRHMELARELHKVHTLIVVDHTDCGAYKLLTPGITPANENISHLSNLKTIADEARKRFPGLKVETYLMDMRGTIENAL